MIRPFLLLIASAIVAPAALAQTSVVAKRNPLQMDVAGIRLGMPHEQAVKALQAAAYTCQPFSKEATFSEQVDAEVAKRRGQSTLFRQNSGPMELTCKGPGQEHLKIWFAQVRSGPIVDEFRLLVDAKVVDGASLRPQLAARYGKPTEGDERSGIWCDPQFRCNGAGIYADGPAISIKTDFGLDIMATRGRKAREADLAEVIKAADAIAPKRTKAAF